MLYNSISSGSLWNMVKTTLAKLTRINKQVDVVFAYPFLQNHEIICDLETVLSLYNNSMINQTCLSCKHVCRLSFVGL